MAKLKIINRFGITPNDILNNSNLTWKAKGLYAYIQSKPDDWEFAVNRIAKDAKDGRDSTGNGIIELEEAGYLVRKKFKNDKGQWDIEYTLFDRPVTENPERLENETVTENPSPENPSTENPETNKKRNSKKENSNKEIYISDEILNKNFLDFIEHRKQIKKPMTELAVTRMVNKINTFLLKYKKEEIIDFIDLAIRNGWQDIYDKKDFAAPQKNKKLAYETTERGSFTF